MQAEKKMKKLLIMTVAYNEEKKIGTVLEDIKKLFFKTFKKSFIKNASQKENFTKETLCLNMHNHNLDLDYEIIVVNDGSTDNTANIAKKYVGVITHPVNLGPGVAVQTGYKYAIRNKFDYIVKLDSDGQHQPKYIPKLLELVLKDEAEGGYRFTIFTR